MDYLETLKNIFVTESAQRLYASIPNEHVFPALKDGDFEPGNSYLRLWITDMYLDLERVLYQKRYPLVHAFCHFLYHGKVEEVPLVAGQNQIKGLGSATDRAINLNYRLIGPVPFNGGEVEVLVALVHMQAADYGSQLLDVLGSLSHFVGGGEFQIAMQFLPLLKSGVDGLFSLKPQAHLVLHNTFTSGATSPNHLRAGYWITMDDKNNKVDPNQLWVKEGRLYIGKSMEAAKLFEGADYFLFYIEKVDQRDDFSGISSVGKAWEDTITQATKGSQDEINLAFETFKGVVLASSDLIWSDQVHLIQTLSAKVKAIAKMRSHRQFSSALETGMDAALVEAARNPDAKQIARSDLLKLSWK